MHELKIPLTVLGILVALLAGVYALTFLWGGTQMMRGADDAVAIDMFTPIPPSPEVLAQLEKSRGFEVLVSYTNRGFEPPEAVIRIGESVRFTNNSKSDLWVAANGNAKMPVYPGASECGGSAFDACKSLKPLEFWEFTFERSGVWTFKNNLDKGKTGSVRVEVRE